MPTPMELSIPARRAIESLRSGVPSRQAVRHLGTTQVEIEQAFRDRLAACEAGKGTTPLVIAANFGEGKSHLLEYLQAISEQAGYVTAYLVVSPEMPLGNAHVVLKTLSESASAPGRVGKALRELSSDLNTDSSPYVALKDWARHSGIDARFVALLHLYQAFRADEDLRMQILDDFEGKVLAKGTIKQKLKEIDAHKDFSLGSVRNPLLAHDRLQLLSQVFRATGCRGLVVLFDELERMAFFSYKQRVAAYEQIGWWREVAAQAGSCILPVFAMTAGLLQETITGGSNDAQKLNLAALRSSPEPHDQRIFQGIDLLKDFQELNPISARQERDIHERIRDLYMQAYGAVPDEHGEGNGDDLLPIRTRIRKWITRWDLRRYDADYISDVAVDGVDFDRHEIEDDSLADNGDEGAGEGDCK